MFRIDILLGQTFFCTCQPRISCTIRRWALCSRRCTDKPSQTRCPPASPRWDPRSARTRNSPWFACTSPQGIPGMLRDQCVLCTCPSRIAGKTDWVLWSPRRTGRPSPRRCPPVTTCQQKHTARTRQCLRWPCTSPQSIADSLRTPQLICTCPPHRPCKPRRCTRCSLDALCRRAPCSRLRTGTPATRCCPPARRRRRYTTGTRQNP